MLVTTGLAISCRHEARQARHFLKYAKHAILWRTPSTKAYQVHRARKHANTWARQARYLADSL